MTPDIAGYEIKDRLAALFASALFAARDGGRDVLIKTLTTPYPAADDIKRLEREHGVLTHLAGRPGILPAGDLVHYGAGVPALVVPVTGETLRRALDRGAARDWPLTRSIALAIQLAEALSAVHDGGVIHKNLAPHNILLGPELDSETGHATSSPPSGPTSGPIWLMNFEIATVLANERQERVISKRLQGSLPYIAPEQTGRMAVDLDYRTDFYSLGVVLYELLTGALPYRAETRLEWVHAHISRRPNPPDSPLPAPLWNIVLRLLSKSPEERYQSSFGLLHDLRHCLAELETTGEIADFALGSRDVSEAFHIPQVLIGRDPEMAQLHHLYQEAEAGRPQICFIGGYSGVGKSALVDALSASGVRGAGFFIRGKFDQFERARPYAAVAAAFDGLVHEILTESDAALADWRARLSAAVAPNGAALLDLVPDLARIIGPQPDLPPLPPTEAHNRLQLTVQAFLREVSGPGRPLVFYLDDLQWSDGPTLRLLASFATARDLGHVLILGAYRDNEVDATHLLSLARAEIEKTRSVHDLILAPLPGDAVAQICTLALRRTGAAVDRLAALLHQKTEGNPFFVKELLRSMVEDGLIRFDRAQGRWSWSLAEVQRADIGDTVVDFLIANLEKLAPQTRDALRLAACLGNKFDLDTLAQVSGQEVAHLGGLMIQALERNILLPLDEGYQHFDSAAAQDTLPGTEGPGDGINPRYQFQHDRLHQAAYEGLPPDARAQVHLRIGRQLRARVGVAPEGAEAVDIVRHLNEAQALIPEAAERESLARLNLAAAHFAHDASSFRTALHYVETGRALLPEGGWTTTPKLAKELSTLYAQTAYLTGAVAASEAEIDRALAHASTPLEKAQILSMRTRHYSTLGRMQDSIEAALQGLQLLGVDIAADLPDAVVAAEISAIEANLQGRAIRDLVQAERMNDPVASCAVGLLMEIFPAAFLSGAGNLFHFLIARSVNISLQHGNSTETAFAYAAYGMLLCGALDDPARGLQYGELALEMNEKFEDIGLKSRIIYVYAMFIHHWSHHWTSMTDWFKKGLEAGYQSGDLLYLAYNAQDCIIWDPRLDVETAITEQQRYLEIVQDTNYRDSYDSGTLYLQMLMNFAGRTVDAGSLTSEAFDEAACLEGMQERRFMTGVANYHIYKAEIFTLYGDWTRAAHHIAEQDKLIASVMSLPQLTRFRLISCLTFLGRYGQMPPKAQAQTRARLARDIAQVEIWAANCPQNFGHILEVQRGALAQMEGQSMAALRHFARALAAARTHGYLRDEALIAELCATTLLAQDLPEAAQAYLSKARYLFERWGATRKVAALEAAHPDLIRQRIHPGTGPKTGPKIGPKTDSSTDSNTDSRTGLGTGPAREDAGTALESLDLASVMKAAQVISGERKLAALLTRTMDILLEAAGAERGVFALQNGASLSVEIAQTVTGPDAPDLPETLVQYALRTRAPVVLEDAARAGAFASDPYIKARKTRSVLCVPIFRSEGFQGAIYLENDLAAGAFSADRVAIVEMLAAQAAISIENARFYVELEQKVADRTQALSQKTTALESLASQLSKYLSPQVYRSIFDSKQEVKLASSRKRLTVFFSDLVGFTDTADTLESEDLTRILNHYLTEMSAIALAHGATIDKFVGDAIVIFFGDPETRGQREDAAACLRMAVAMRAKLSELRRFWRAEGIEKPMQARMGIHTGYCAVGNFGSEDRMDYTIIGGSVNLAARLESAAEAGQILISYETQALVDDVVATVPKGQVTVKGIARPVQTYQVVDLVENLGAADAPIRAETEALHLSVEPARMSPEERRAAALSLRAAAAQLEEGLGPQRSDAPQEPGQVGE